MAVVTKSERVVLAATKTQVASWKLVADEAGMSLSELLRRGAEKLVRELASSAS
jgi:hypothetical protein